MKKLIFIVFLLLPIFIYADTKSPFYLYHSGYYTESIPGLNKLGNVKNGEALYYLATIYINGYGMTKNFNKGIKLMTRSGEQKYPPAQIYLGKYYLYQKKDLEKSLYWLKKSASNGNINAQMFVAIAYLNGYGVKKNVDIAQRYIIYAAKSGNAMAQYELSVMFLASKHAMNRKLGLIWLRKSADKKYSDAEYKLGMMYYTGDRVEKDINKGITLLENSAHSGNVAAKLQLKHLNENKDINSLENDEVTNKSSDEKLKPNNDEVANKNSDKKLKPNEGNPTKSIFTVMRKASLSLKPNKSAIDANSAMIMTPRILPITKHQIFKPNYILIEPNNIPIINFIAYMQKRAYKKQKDQLIIPLYKYHRPKGTIDETQMFAILKRQASHGYVNALYRLGQMYENGITVPKNDKKAFMLYLKAAKQGYLKAEYMIGVYYLQGNIVVRDYKLAIKWLALAALKGSPQAQYLLGNIYEFGLDDNNHSESISRNIQKAIAMYNLAVGNGIVLAQYRLAQLYASNIDNPNNEPYLVNKNLTMAYKLFQKSVSENITNADVALAYFYAAKNQSEENHQWAFKVAKRAARSGDANAQFLLAILYDRGIGVSVNKYKAIKLYKKAVKRGNRFAEFMLGTYYYTGEGVRKNKNKAIQLLSNSSDQGSGYALYNLAIMSYSRNDIESEKTFISFLNRAANKNFNQAKLLLADYYLLQGNNADRVKMAVKMYQYLSENGNSSAKVKLGYMYEHGIYLKKNLKTALELYQQAADLNNPVALYLLGNMYQLGKSENRNINLSIKYYTKSAEMNFIPAKVALGFIYEMELHNYASAIKWYNSAIDSNNSQAQYNLALMYQYGKGTKRNYKEAYVMYKKASDNGFVLAEFALANMYLKGQWVSQNPKKSLEIYQNLAKKGNNYAYYQVGLMAESGVGADINLQNALVNYNRASENGSIKADLALGRFYDYGIGVSRDKSTAIKYYMQAAKNGSQFAKDRLEALNKKKGEKHVVTSLSKTLATDDITFLNKLKYLFRSSPNLLYMHALNELNAGKKHSALMSLKKIMKRYPYFKPARTMFNLIINNSKSS